MAVVLYCNRANATHIFLVRNKSDTLEQNWRELKL